MDLSDLKNFDLSLFMRERRERLGLSEDAVVQQLKGVPIQQLQSWEAKKEPVPLLRLGEIAVALKVDPDLLTLRVLQQTMPECVPIIESALGCILRGKTPSNGGLCQSTQEHDKYQDGES